MGFSVAAGETHSAGPYPMDEGAALAQYNVVICQCWATVL